MSRIGKKAITVPAGVEVTVNDHKEIGRASCRERV